MCRSGLILKRTMKCNARVGNCLERPANTFEVRIKASQPQIEAAVGNWHVLAAHHYTGSASAEVAQVSILLSVQAQASALHIGESLRSFLDFLLPMFILIFFLFHQIFLFEFSL